MTNVLSLSTWIKFSAHLDDLSDKNSNKCNTAIIATNFNRVLLAPHQVK